MSELDDLAELMEEPPGGHNSGRTRIGGVWVDLDNTFASVMEAGLTVHENPEWSSGRRSEKPADTIVHGTRSAYVNDRCRCDACRAAEREYKRRRRSDSRDVTS